MEKENNLSQRSGFINNHKWWFPIKEAFAGISLKGLKVNCPQCKEKGLVITRWIKGPVLKPVYIFHIRRDKVRKVCELDEEQSIQIRERFPYSRVILSGF